MKKQNEPVRINLHASYIVPVFRSLYTSTERTVLCWGGASSGKSYAVIQRMIIKALESKRRVLVVRKVATTLRDSVFHMTKEIAETMGISQLKGYKVTSSNLEVTLPNGSTFIYMGMDDPEKLKSISSITDIIIEECTEINEEDFNQLQLRLRANVPNPQIFMMMNPISKSNWTYRYFFQDAVPPNTLLHHSTYKDNLEHQAEDFIAQMEFLKEHDPDYYKQYGEGQFTNQSKAIFSNWKVEEFNPQQIIKDNSQVQSAFGLDFGFVDPATFLCSLVDMTNWKLYIFDEIYQRGLLNSELAELIFNKGFSRERIVADSSRPEIIEEMKTLHGLHRIQSSKKGAGSIIAGISFLKQFEIIVHPSCKHTIEELENYSYQKDKDGQYIDKPVDAHNHCIDALRYSLEPYRTNKSNKLVFLPKSAFGIY